MSQTKKAVLMQKSLLAVAVTLAMGTMSGQAMAAAVSDKVTFYTPTEFNALNGVTTTYADGVFFGATINGNADTTALNTALIGGSYDATATAKWTANVSDINIGNATTRYSKVVTLRANRDSTDIGTIVPVANGSNVSNFTTADQILSLSNKGGTVELTKLAIFSSVGANVTIAGALDLVGKLSDNGTAATEPTADSFLITDSTIDSAVTGANGSVAVNIETRRDAATNSNSTITLSNVTINSTANGTGSLGATAVKVQAGSDTPITISASRLTASASETDKEAIALDLGNDVGVHTLADARYVTINGGSVLAASVASGIGAYSISEVASISTTGAAVTPMDTVNISESTLLSSNIRLKTDIKAVQTLVANDQINNTLTLNLDGSSIVSNTETPIVINVSAEKGSGTDIAGAKVNSILNLNLDNNSRMTANVVAFTNKSGGNATYGATNNINLKGGSLWRGNTLTKNMGDNTLEVNTINVSLEGAGTAWSVSEPGTAATNEVYNSINALTVKNGATLDLSGSVGNLTVETLGSTDTAGKADSGGIINFGDASLGVGHHEASTLTITGKNSGRYAVKMGSSLSASLVTVPDPAHPLISVTSTTEADNKASFAVAPIAEFGLYQYDLVNQYDAATKKYTNNYVVAKTERASTVSAAVQAMAAAPVQLANLGFDTLTARQDAARLGNDSGGVWISYMGSKQNADTEGGASYKLNSNGVMVGGDTRLQTNNGSWLAGVAVSSVKGKLNIKTSAGGSGESNGYSFQAYLSRTFDNGVFIDTAAQFGHFSNSVEFHMLNDTTLLSGSNGTNGFGASVKGGYLWQSGMGVFVEPYLKLSALNVQSSVYTLKGKGVREDEQRTAVVMGNGYSSVLGEIGAKAGYRFDAGSVTVKPYLHIAGLDEFAAGNSVDAGVVLDDNGLVNNSVNGGALRVGAGVQADFTKNLGAYATLDYTTGKHIESPIQGLVGVSVMW